MKITEITKGKGKLWAVRLEDDSTLWLHSDLLYGAGLRTGDDLTEERIADLRQQAAEHRAYEYGLYLLEKRGYSYRELYDRLMTAPEAQETAVLQALEKLTRYGFVNDARYAEQLAAHYVEGKKYGLRRAAFEMKHRGLSQTDIDDALAAYDNAETISAMLLELLQKKYARYLTDPDDRKSTEKVTAALVRRGFTYQQIRYALEDYFALIGEA
ncbi:MAG: regulatory protein RecX [Oscillospiraceae bacterium]|nr:regulatory protein RecX [Oscillospiraceae bacterium]MBQ5338198.1 regulatory protein RecX [Oscillospiraceae bacterium]MBR5362305.1 regulatory protein RecX [Oscillospiraceae bacterium]